MNIDGLFSALDTIVDGTGRFAVYIRIGKRGEEVEGFEKVGDTNIYEITNKSDLDQLVSDEASFACLNDRLRRFMVNYV